MDNGLIERLAVMFGGYVVGDDPELRGRREDPAWCYELRPRGFGNRAEDFGLSVVAPRSGLCRVRAVYRVIYHPLFWSTTWKPDGTPERPARASLFERFELERTVLVE